MVISRQVMRGAVLVTTVLACASPTGPSSGLVPSLVAASRDSTGIVRFEVDWRNVGVVPLYLSACGGRASMWLERRGAGGWEGFGGGICSANLDGTPVRVDPSESVRATVGVGPGAPGEYRAAIPASDGVNGEWTIVRSAGARVP